MISKLGLFFFDYDNELDEGVDEKMIEEKYNDDDDVMEEKKFNEKLKLK